MAASAGALYLFFVLIFNSSRFSGLTFPSKLQHYSYSVNLLGLSIMSLFVAFKSKGSKGVYLVASFWSALVLSNVFGTILHDYHLARVLVTALTSAIVAPLLIYSTQYFPEPINPTDIRQTIKSKWLNRLLIWLLKPINTWLYFALAVLMLYLALSFVDIPLPIPEIIIMVIALMFMTVNYRQSASRGRNSILWFFWGILSQLLVVTFFGLLDVFSWVTNPYTHVVASYLSSLILLTSMFMSVFFADSFDTGIIIKRTLVNGFLFLFIILIFNTSEHYLMHAINEHFEINDAFASSFLSAILILFIQPLHHKLEHFLDHKLKRDAAHSAVNHHSEQNKH
jgi:hypothetical protein